MPPVPDPPQAPGPAGPGGHQPSQPEVLERRRRVVLAGHLGDGAAADAARRDPAPAVRSAALGALERLGRLDDEAAAEAFDDPAPVVRRRGSELAATRPVLADRLIRALGDPDATVVEAAAFALGELGHPVAGVRAAPALAAVVGGHDDPLCREAAVAALGALGDPAGLPAILAATADKPAVRRRAILALAPFDGPEVDAALARAAGDRDWQVRQAAEDLAT